MNLTQDELLKIADGFVKSKISEGPGSLHQAYTLAQFISFGGLDGLTCGKVGVDVDAENRRILNERVSVDIAKEAAQLDKYRKRLLTSIDDSERHLIGLKKELANFDSGDMRGFNQTRKSPYW